MANVGLRQSQKYHYSCLSEVLFLGLSKLWLALQAEDLLHGDDVRLDVGQALLLLDRSACLRISIVSTLLLRGVV